MSREAEVEMREEYDFSGAVRGRHAGRFTEQGRQDLLRQAASQDVQVWTTHALMQVQQLEAALFTCLHLALGAPPETALREVTTIVERRQVQSWNQFVHNLLPLESAANELKADLRRAMSERNWLVHRSSDELQQALASPESAIPLLQRLRSLAALAASARTRVEGLMEQHLAHQGWTQQEISSRSSSAREIWRTAA